MQKLLNIIVVLILFTACSSKENVEALSPQTEKTSELRKLTKTIEVIEKFYIDKIERYELVNLTIQGMLAELKGELNSDLVNSLKKEYKKSSDSKDECYTKLKKTMEDISNNTTYNLEETINTALTVLMDNLDTYSTYINKNIKIKGHTKTLHLKPFYSEIIYDKYLYLRVGTFDSKTVNNIKHEVLNGNGRVEGIVLDLRDNTGGLFKQAIATVDLFVNKGLIISQRGRDTNNVTRYRASSKKTISNLPLVVLVNKKSASASEIVSGALQDLDRAIIVGERTFGKGTIQALIPITEDKKELIKLTIARYYLPNGRPVNNKVVPDIEVLESDFNNNNFDNLLDAAIGNI